MHPGVHCSPVYNSQDMEATQMSTNRGVDKEDVVHTYNGINSAIEKTKTAPFAEIRMDLETAMVAQMVKRLPTMPETRFNPWVRKIPWRRKWQPTPVLLPKKFHGQRSLVDCNPGVRKEADVSEHAHSGCTHVAKF